MSHVFHVSTFLFLSLNVLTKNGGGANAKFSPPQSPSKTATKIRFGRTLIIYLNVSYRIYTLLLWTSPFCYRHFDLVWLLFFAGEASDRWTTADHLRSARPLPRLQPSAAQHLVGLLAGSQLGHGENHRSRRRVYGRIHRHNSGVRS